MSGGIPTIGPRHINFRSRIEARWAHIFDRLGWAWEYEPYDLIGYIPDFIVTVDCTHVLIEVKHVVDIWDQLRYYEHLVKIIRSGWKGRYLIVGANIRKEDGVIGVGGIGGDHCDWKCALVDNKWTLFGINNDQSLQSNIGSNEILSKYWVDTQNITQWFPGNTLTDSSEAQESIMSRVVRAFGFKEIIIFKGRDNKRHEFKNQMDNTVIPGEDALDLILMPNDEYWHRVTFKTQYHLRVRMADDAWITTGASEGKRIALKTETWLELVGISDDTALESIVKAYPLLRREDNYDMSYLLELLARDTLDPKTRVVPCAPSTSGGPGECVVCASSIPAGRNHHRIMTTGNMGPVELKMCAKCWWIHDPDCIDHVFNEFDPVVFTHADGAQYTYDYALT